MSYSRTVRCGLAVGSAVMGGRAVPGIVGGNNRGYAATPGRDEVTGVGVLDIAVLNQVIASSWSP